ncbi:glycosyl transferase family 2 [Opitutaceae bacterium EW11]|nr:glycosyl transferase family 2 [Opitutaceae bacterium EW11]
MIAPAPRLSSPLLAAVLLAVRLAGSPAPTAPAVDVSVGTLRREFAGSPVSKPGVYWWWLDGAVNRQAITKSLEELAAKGVGEVLLVNSANLRRTEELKNTVTFLSPEWRELYRHALREADRLGISVGVNLSGGWCMGGPWIPPRYAGRWFLQSRLTVEGPRKFAERLPLPGHRDGYDRVFNPPGFEQYVDLPLADLDYRDTAVVALPEPAADHARLDRKRAQLLAAKSNRRDATNFTRARDVMGPTLAPWRNTPEDHPISPAAVVDLTARMRPDGYLEWEVPPGRWTIIRTGHRMTGSRLMIPPPEADGLSVGWLSGEGVDLQFQHLGKLLLEDAASVGVKLAYFCDDSFEDGFPNWTEKILERFREYRGYDPVPYLPVLSGYLVGSAELSDRFLYDYRKTVAACMADGHYQRFAELCHQNGLLVQDESAGPSRSGTMCMDGLMNLGRSDLPMGEFWLGLRHDEAGGLDPKLPYGVSRLEDGQNKVTKMVASAAHTYGRPLASAESFTTNRHWLDYPGSLKPAADRAFCEGINRLVIHCSTLARAEDGKPGHEYYAGTHFNPNVTWWDKTKPFLDYLARCQRLLQQGRFAADVLYYHGDWAPNIVEPKHVDPSLGEGYDYDVCNAEVLLTRVGVKDGRLVLPDGINYRLLVLPDTTRMPVEVIAKLKELVAAGATIVGPKPHEDPGLRNYPKADEEVRRLAAELWGDCDGRNVTQHPFGAGRVCWGVPLRDLLRAEGVGPDFAYDRKGGTSLAFIHRTTRDAEVYFVVNRENAAASAECSFRVAGRRPEIWDPVLGLSRRANAFSEAAGGTLLRLSFAPHQSYFVVFPKDSSAAGSEAGPDFPAYRTVQDVTGPWTVKFDPKWGGPAEVVFPELTDWTQRPEQGIRHYSGTATYVKRFDLTGAPAGRLYLELGTVRNIADVRLNGKALGIVWTAPWRIEITNAVRPRDNLLEIEVVNLWPNRLIGDAPLPRDQRLTRTNIAVDATTPLLPSGLLGPVRLLEEDRRATE